MIALRFTRQWGPHRIGTHRGIPRSTVGRVLQRYAMPRLEYMDQATGPPVRRPAPNRYEASAPGKTVCQNPGNSWPGNLSSRDFGTLSRSDARQSGWAGPPCRQLPPLNRSATAPSRYWTARSCRTAKSTHCSTLAGTSPRQPARCFSSSVTRGVFVQADPPAEEMLPGRMAQGGCFYSFATCLRSARRRWTAGLEDRLLLVRTAIVRLGVGLTSSLTATRSESARAEK